MAELDPIILPVKIKVDDAGVKAAADQTAATIKTSLNKSSDGEGTPHGGPRNRDVGEGAGTHYVNVEQRLFGETAKEASESTASVRLFREAIHALRPTLAEAGVGVGRLAEYVSAARGGFVALGVAVGGALITSVEKAHDAVGDATSKLGAFSGSDIEGKNQYAALSDTADKLQTPTSGLVDPFLEAARLNKTQPKELQETDAGLRDVISNIVKGAQSERQPVDKTEETFTKFLAAGREKGFFGKEDLKVLDSIPKTLDAIVSKLPKGQDTFTGPQVFGAIRGAGPQIDAHAIEAQALPESISQAWERVKASYEKAESVAPGGDVIAKVLDGFTGFLNTVANARKRAQEAAKDADASEKIQPTRFGQPQPRLDTGEYSSSTVLGTRDLNQGPPTKPVPEPFTAFDAEHAARGAPEAEKAAASIPDTTGISAGLAKRIADFGITNKDALEAKSTDLGLEQAQIEKKYEPEETASKLAHAEISVESADMHLAQANIQGLEADKNKELAKDAKPEAEHRVDDAQANYDRAVAKVQGQDLKAYDAQHESANDRRALANAEDALRKAQIEKKYSYLDAPKAALAADQSQLAIRSAKLEKNDATLRFNRQQEQGPISHELQQLKYSEAMLKESEQQTQDGAKDTTLREILGVLKTRSENPEDKANQPHLETASEKEAREGKARADDAAKVESDRKFKAAADSRSYEQNAQQTGWRTVEGDQAAREQAFSHGKHYGNESSVEGDRIAREKGSGHQDLNKFDTPAEKLNTAGDKLIEAAEAIKGNRGGGTGKPSTDAEPSSSSKLPDAESSSSSKLPDAESSSSSKLPKVTHGEYDSSYDPKKIQDALDKFKSQGPRSLEQTDPEAFKALQDLNDRSDGSKSGSVPTTRDQLDKTFNNQKQIGEYEGVQAGHFTKDFRKDNFGLGKFDKPVDKMGLGSPSPHGESHGIVPHPDGGKADLSEKLYPGGPDRYRYQSDRNYQPSEVGHYDENMSFVPNKDQPYPRMRQKPHKSPDRYNSLEDTFDTKGGGEGFPGTGSRRDNNPIYNYGQPQPMDFPSYTKSLRDSLPPVPLPQPRPPGADVGGAAQSAAPAIQNLGQVAASASASLSTFAQTKQAGPVAPLPAPATAVPASAPAPAPAPAPAAAAPTDINSTVSALSGALSSLAGSVSDAGSALSSLVSSAASAGAALSAITTPAAPVATPATISAAGGYGPIEGPGSTTSDSIIARVSRGEYITQAAAVQKYGADFFHSVNNMTFPGFALGGFPLPATPHSSGLMGVTPSATSVVNLSLDGRSFNGFRGPKSTVEELSSFAIARQTSAAGDNPSWMR